MLPRFNIWISLPTTFLTATVAMMLFSGHSLSAQELNASDGALEDEFGESVSLSGNTGLIGAPGDDDNLNPLGGIFSSSGSAYIFRNLVTATGTVNESVKLLASDGAAFDLFGESVSLSGNTGLIGARGDDDNGSIAGSAYIFRNLDTATGTVNESVKLLASDGEALDQFGESVSLSGNTGLIGASRDDDNGSNSGAAYIFRNLDTATGTVNESAKLLISDGAAWAFFGEAVSLSGNTGLIGSFSESAYIFRDLDTATGTVNESVKLLASDSEAFDTFGESLSLSGNTGLIGARGDSLASGSAYIFRDLNTATGTVNESVKLLASDGAEGDRFGVSVSLDGDRFTVGASSGDVGRPIQVRSVR